MSVAGCVDLWVCRVMELLLTLFVALSMTFSSTASGSDVFTGEFCQFEIFNATCSLNEIILMQSAIYGRQRVGKCVKSEHRFIDCKADVLGFADHRCSGRRYCKFPVAEISSHQGIKPCDEYTSHLEASYRCVQVDDVGGSSCSTLRHKIVKSQHFGYLAQSFQADRIVSPMTCGWILEAEPGHRIQITIFYFASANSAGDWPPPHGSSSSAGNDVTFSCRRLAKIRDRSSGKETNVCVAKERVKNVFQSEGHSVEILLMRTHENSQDARFLFRFEVTGCGIPSYPGMHVVMTSERTADVVCNVTSRRWPLTCVDGNWVGGLGECTQSFVDAGSDVSAWATLNYEWKSAKGLTLVVGLGIILGIAVGILMLAIAACLIRGDHLCLPRGERCSELEMVEDGGHLVDQTETTSQWICANNADRYDKELLSADIWRMCDQRSGQIPSSTAVAAGAPSERHPSSAGYQTFCADCSLTGSQMGPEMTAPCSLAVREGGVCPTGAPVSLRHCYDTPVI